MHDSEDALIAFLHIRNVVLPGHEILVIVNSDFDVRVGLELLVRALASK